MDEYNIEKSIKAQAKYCVENGLPHFAPKNGFCWKCLKSIYEPHNKIIGNREYVTGITTEQAGSTLVTGCPHCNISFCD